MKLKLYTPRQIADMFGVSTNTIRNLEKTHNIIPLRLPSGYRKYTEDNVKAIKKLFNFENVQ